MNGEFHLHAVLMEILENILSGITGFLPRLLTALVVVLVGWIVARIVQKVLTTILERIKLDALLHKAGVSESLERINLRETPAIWLPRLVFYLLLIFFVKTATQVAGMTEISNMIAAFFGYLPSLVAAIIIILLGSTIGQFAGRAVTHAAGESGVEYAPMLGRLVSALIFFVVSVMAIAQLRIDMQLVNAVVLIVFAGFALAFALSFGLGTREITRNMVAGFYARKIFRAGDEVVLNGERGILRAITPITTVIEREGRRVNVPNSVFLEGMTGK